MTIPLDPTPSDTKYTRYDFCRNNPFDRNAPVRMAVERLQDSCAYMRSIRQFSVEKDAIAIWYLGQNGFLLKDFSGLLIGIDLYLTDSCATTFADLPFRLDRQLPVFVEPEDLDVDVFVTTHSHDDHADPETIRRMKTETTTFVGPFDAMRVFRECGVPEERCKLIHPGELMSLNETTTLQATFAMPTDASDLNHTGMLVEFGNGIRFYNTGDTAYTERLAELLPREVDVCSICINGGFHNLAPLQAAAIIMAIRPRVAIPCHYDMMINNVGSPEMFRMALELARSEAKFVQMRYYEPWLYERRDLDDAVTR